MAVVAGARAATAILIFARSTLARKRKLLLATKPDRTSPFFLSGDYVSAGDLTFALGRLFAAVAQGHVKPKTAGTLAVLGQTLVKTLQLAQNEYISAFGSESWERTVAHNFKEDGDRQCPPKPVPQLPSGPQAANEPAQLESPVPEKGPNTTLN